MKKNDITILLGNILDKYDTSLYSFLAPVLAPLFFPHHDPAVQLILTYATSFTSVCARPCGAFFFGMYARRYGPLCSLSYSLLGVALTTMIIGLIPDYHVVGWYAPLCLILVRFLRGICAAGESAVAKVYIMENKHDHDALRISYWYQSSSMMGIVMASCVSTMVISLYPCAWRYCFLLGGITGLVALYMRMSCANEAIVAHNYAYRGYTYDGLRLLLQEKENVLRVALVTVVSHITYSIPFVFMNIFVPRITDISVATMMQYNTFLLLFDMIAVPLIGRYMYVCNAAKTMICASLIIACTIIPLFYGLPGASLWYILFVRIWIVVWGIIFLCPLNFWCKNIFKKTEDAYFLVGMAGAIGSGTLGHVTTPFCLWLWYVTDYAWAPAVYVAVIMGMAVYAVRSVK